MWFSASLTAYDAMGEVHVTVRVWGDGGMGEEQMTPQLSCATTVHGTGESDPQEWLKDALVAMLETL